MTSTPAARLLLKTAELSGGISQFHATLKHLPDANFAAAPLTTQFSQMVACSIALGAKARAHDPATPDSVTAHELGTQLHPQLFAAGSVLFAKAMRVNPDDKGNSDILGHLALLRHRTPAQTSALNQNWLRLAQHHALRGHYDKCAQVAQDAIASESVFAPGETQAQNQLTAAAIWHGRGKNPFGPAYSKAQRTQSLRHGLHTGSKAFFAALVATPLVSLAGTITTFSVIVPVLGGFSSVGALAFIGTTAAATLGASYYIARAAMRRANRHLEPVLAPATPRAKRVTLSKLAGGVAGVVLGIGTAFNIMGAFSGPEPEPVYYKKQSPHREEKPDDWQKSAKFKLPRAGQTLTL